MLLFRKSFICNVYFSFNSFWYHMIISSQISAWCCLPLIKCVLQKMVLQCFKHKEITFPHELIFVCNQYFVGMRLFKKCCQKLGVRKTIKGEGGFSIEGCSNLLRGAVYRRGVQAFCRTPKEIEYCFLLKEWNAWTVSKS